MVYERDMVYARDMIGLDRDLVQWRKEKDPAFHSKHCIKDDEVRKIRKALRGYDIKDEAGFDFVRGDYDSSVWKKFIPDTKFTPEEKNAIEDELWIDFHDPYGDGRDCTGATFTSWIRFFYVGTGTWIYHHKSLDL